MTGLACGFRGSRMKETMGEAEARQCGSGGQPKSPSDLKPCFYKANLNEVLVP